MLFKIVTRVCLLASFIQIAIYVSIVNFCQFEPHILDELAVCRKNIRNKSHKQGLEAHAQQHRGKNERLDMPHTTSGDEKIQKSKPDNETTHE